MGSRIDLQNLLETLLDSEHVYFQPPATVKMEYPCIVYSHSDTKTLFADNTPYVHTLRYQIIVIDADPDSTIPGKIANLPMCKFQRHYTADNLNHDVYNLYY
jgi:hypothetical protein